MKEMAICFVIALVLSCIVNSIIYERQQFPSPVGISGINEGKAGSERDDSYVGEVNLTDGYRADGYTSEVLDHNKERGGTFPGFVN